MFAKSALILGLILGSGLSSPIDSFAKEPVALGPFAQAFSLTLDPDTRREEAFGPLLSHESSEFFNQWAVHPFFSYRENYNPEFRELDFLYPVITYDQFGSEYRFQLFQLLSYSGGQHQSDIPVSRVTIFPIYFQQRSEDPEKNYTALLPFYGTIKKRLMRDEIHFVMFPLYARTRKADVTTYNYLYPIFHLREGNGLEGWQLWPLGGYEEKQITQKTNDFDQVEAIGGHRRLSAIWPLFSNQYNGLGTDNPEHSQALLPLYYFRRSPKKDSTTIVWPFFNFLDDRQREYKEWAAPWPFVTFGRGTNQEISRVWPFYSEARKGRNSSKLIMWPLYRYTHLDAPNIERKQTRILLFLYSDLSDQAKPVGGERRQISLWPLFTSRRDREGNERLQILAPLEPILPNHKSIERNYSPVWSIWRSEKNVKTGQTSQSLLWNLYRAEQSSSTRRFSFLFGLFKRESGPDGTRWRLFYIPLSRKSNDVNVN